MLSFYLNLALSDKERNIVEILYNNHYINICFIRSYMHFAAFI